MIVCEANWHDETQHPTDSIVLLLKFEFIIYLHFDFTDCYIICTDINLKALAHISISISIRSKVIADKMVSHFEQRVNYVRS